MAKVLVIWDDANDLDGNIQHIACHNVTTAEVEYVLNNPRGTADFSRRHGHPISFAKTKAGRYLAVVFTIVTMKPRTVRPITAYDVPLPGAKP